ncbi:barstar family protein [Planococcus sp. APC 3906]|uniref:barstar family protein n=1 Tax=Planococcus sp. APC 3906 TaxID=3035194 RepID=UPI0025B2CB95|nr:barstar family protein [Planococcus sp. APC 3906]MDN3451844.1 barstar family protein [Planococcus sp. APC 3906]
MLNGSIILFRKTDILEKTSRKIEAEGFEIVRFDCGEWDEELFHKEVARKLNFPAYYGENLNAFSDCLSDLPINNTGILLVFTHFQSFLAKHPEVAIAMLELIHINSWRFLLEGKAVISFIHSTDPEISLPAIGGMVPEWNGEEWFDKDRGIIN